MGEKDEETIKRERIIKQYEDLKKTTLVYLKEPHPMRLKLCNILILWNFRHVIRRL